MSALSRCALAHLRHDYDTPYEDDGLHTYDDIDAYLKALRCGNSRCDDILGRERSELDYVNCSDWRPERGWGDVVKSDSARFTQIYTS